MSSWPDPQLLLAIALVVVAAAVLVWTLVSQTRRVGLLMSESRVPRRYMVLGLAAGLGILYLTRR